MFLHAWKIRFPHPANRTVVSLESPLPNELKSFLHELSKLEKQDYGEKF